MTTTTNKYLHEVKGPTHLSPATIKDIVESRPLPHARDDLAKKYGISVNRVGNIWKDYYGGTTLKDYKSGLKKELPTDIVKTADITTRRFKSERGLYSAKDPKVIDHANAKAQAIRKVAPMPTQKRAVNDLDLDNTDDMGDTEAQILAGEVSAGNNSGELLSAIQLMLEHNQNISDRAVSALEKALRVASKMRRDNKYNDETDYEATDIEDSNYAVSNDDSTIGYKKVATPISHKGSRVVQQPEGDPGSSLGDTRYYEDDIQEQRGSDSQYYPALGVRQSGDVRLAGLDQGSTRLREGAAGPGTRAQPVYRTERNRPAVSTDEEQGDYYQNSRYQSEVPTTEYYGRQRGIQPNITYDVTKQYSQSEPSTNISGRSGDRSGQTVPGIPWLRVRKG